MKHLSLRTKLIIMVTGALILAISASAFMIRDLFYQNLLDQKITTVDILTASLVHDIKFDYEFRDQVSIKEIIRKYITYYRIINNISFYDSELVNIADSHQDHLGQITSDPDTIAAVSLAKPSIKVIQFDRESLGIRSIAPILQGSKIFGAVIMDVSIDDIESSLWTIDRHIGINLLVTVLVAAVTLFIMLRSSILVRLNQLIKVTQQIASGDYKIRLDDRHADEISQLSLAFDKMTADLQKSKQELEDYHAKNLEQKVQELKQAYKDLKNAQSQLVLNEKMASLGNLVSGIAHEINTPIGAIANVSRNVEKRVGILPGLLDDFKTCTAIANNQICACLEDVIQTSQGINRFLSYKETRAVENLLKKKDINNWREMANSLANLNFTDLEKINKYINCLRNPKIFYLIESIGTIAQAAKISEASSHRIQEIVRALKYYAYTDKGKVEMIRIEDSIHTALVLFRNKIKYKIDVRIEFDPNLPLISCTNEIHQVWTNLLSNAYDAIEQMGEDYPGEISIYAHQKDDRIIVCMVDNGIGLSKEQIEDIFDPFFTTKAIGKGTGLGLSIVSGIIKNHSGTIRVTNLKNPTIFEISLPLTPAPIHAGDQESQLPRRRSERANLAENVFIG